VLKGRLGLETARVPQKDRHGVLWLSRGTLAVTNGTVHFVTPGFDDLPSGDYDIAYQTVNCIVLGPGSTVTHDALRLMHRHGTGIVASGEHGVRYYASMPGGPDTSTIARQQMRLWSDMDKRIDVARKMYAIRMDEIFPHASLNELRGMEGSRSRMRYKLIAQRHGVVWTGRQYDRSKPEGNNAINNAINHASVAVIASAQVAVAIAGTIPQLGFIHEDSGISFALDVADLYRDTVTLECAFAATSEYEQRGGDLEKLVRKQVGKVLRQNKVIAAMIDQQKEVLNGDDLGGDA
jgi:CRISPR-associated protein Cas1